MPLFALQQLETVNVLWGHLQDSLCELLMPLLLLISNVREAVDLPCWYDLGVKGYGNAMWALPRAAFMNLLIP